MSDPYVWPLDLQTPPEPEPTEVPARVSPAVQDAVRRAETAGQRSACALDPGAELPEDLELALERRVEVNLALTGGHPIASVAGDDPDVRALEAPYRKLRAAADSAPVLEQPPGELDTSNPEEE